MRTRIYLLLLTVSIIFGCSSNSKKPSQIRIGQFLKTNEPVEISFKKDKETVFQEQLKFPNLTAYQDLASGIYDVEVKTKGKLLLKEELGIGSDGSYTLIINGLIPENIETNQATTSMRLHEIVEGEEAIHANGDLPQMRILNDEFEVGKNEAKIRWIHLAAGLEMINSVAHSGDSKVKLSSLTYPKISKEYAISPGYTYVNWHLKGNKIEIAQEKIDLKNQYMYTFFVLGKQENYIDNVQVVIGETPKKEF